MAEVWFWLLALMLATYAVLDGFDFGVGMLHFAIGKNAAERDALLRSVGPVWDGNEVWLVAAGGTLFGAFPVLYATVFSGFYLPLMIVLWLLLFRGLGIELRHQIRNPLWHQAWDVAFSAASALLALFFGAALGNLVRGLPLDAQGQFFEPLWTDFRTGTVTGILDWYTLLVGVTACVLLAFHGACWLAFKLEPALAERAHRLALRLWLGAAMLTVLTTIASAKVQPNLVANLSRYPFGIICPALAFAALVTARTQLGKNARRAFLASSLSVAGLVLSAALAIFPHALPARVAGRELSLAAASAHPETLRHMLWWWLPALAIAATYSIVIYRNLPARFRVDGSH